jgi:hypothetical protein
VCVGSLAYTRLFITSLRLSVGMLSFWTSIVIVVQAETNIDLFKDFAALQVSCALSVMRLRKTRLDAEDSLAHQHVSSNEGKCLCSNNCMLRLQV